METNIICFTKLHRNLLKQILACTLSNNQSQTRQKESRLKLKLKVRQFAWRDKLSNTLMGLFMTVLLQSQKQFQIPKNAFFSNSTWRDKHQPQFTHKVSEEIYNCSFILFTKWKKKKKRTWNCWTLSVPVVIILCSW